MELVKLYERMVLCMDLPNLSLDCLLQVKPRWILLLQVQDLENLLIPIRERVPFPPRMISLSWESLTPRIISLPMPWKPSCKVILF